MIDPLYQKEILRLASEATGAGKLEAPDVALTLKNPLCGDQIRLYVTFDAARKVATFAHETRACVLCQASASLVADLAPGRTEEEIAKARNSVSAMLSGGSDWQHSGWQAYGVFTPVIAHPGRHKCVTLPLDALVKAFGEHRAGRDGD